MPIQPDKDKQKYILAMKLINIDTREEIPLFEREESICHFANEIITDDYIIVLRIDWSDIRNSDPVLDADIYKNVSGLKGDRIRTGPWHHTEKKNDPASNKTIYLFKFDNLQLRFMSKISIAVGGFLDAILEK